ncbi:MAG: hypothetical protein U0R71_09985 [Solirubrobacterales bacterium]
MSTARHKWGRGVLRASSAALLGALLLGLCLLAAQRSEAARPPAVRVLSPGDRATLPAQPFWVRVRLAPGAHALRLRLNGHAIGSSQIVRGPGRVRRVQVSPNHGLRYGRNLLRVFVRGRHGARRRETVSFRVRANRPLAAAGLDLFAAPGNRLRLSGARSKVHPSAPGGARALRYRWRIVRRDGRAVGGRAGAVAAGGARLGAPDTIEPSFIADGIETVTIRLTVTAPDGRQGSDLLVVRADPPPSVRLETSARQGDDYGVRLSGPVDAFYKADPAKWLQVVVLRRADLSFVSNTSYECDAATAHPFDAAPELKSCVDRVHAAIANLADKAHSYIAIVVSQPGPNPAVQPPAGVGRALQGFVNVWGWWDPKVKVQRGAYAAVLVPGLVRETVDSASPNQGPGAAIVGNLIRDNEGNYQLTPSERVRFEVNAPGTDATHNVIAIGSQKFEQAVPSGSRGGFQVLVVDPRTLEGRSRWFETAGDGPGLSAMNAFIKTEVEAKTSPFSPTYLVFVASHGTPAMTLTKSLAEGLSELGGKIESLGGTRGRLAAALDSRKAKNTSYVLIGGSNLGGGRGEDTTASGPQVVDGILARGARFYQYAVQPGAAPADDPAARIGSEQLIGVLEQKPTPWPDRGDPGKEAAIRYLGTQVLGTDSPRSQYWTRPYDAGSWEKVAASIKALPFADGQGFNADDFAWAQAELTKEIGWLGNVYAYLGALARPFTENGLKSWAALQLVAEKVQKEVQASPGAQAKARADVIWDLALDLGGHLPIVGDVVDIGAGIYHYATGLAEVENEPADNDFSVQVRELGKRLADRLQAAQTVMTRQFPDVAASDYGRLRTIGACTAPVVSERAACPQDPGSWQFTQDDQAKLAKVVETAAEASAYTALVPARYSLFQFPVDYFTDARYWVGTTLAGAVCWWPFGDLPASAQVARPFFGPPPYDPRSANFDTYQVMALGIKEGAGTITNKFKVSVPAAGLTDHLFGEGADDLGLDRELFFDRYFAHTESLAHFPEDTSPTGWGKLKCPVNEGTVPPLGAPRSVGVASAYRLGVPVSFTVPAGGPATATLTLTLGTAKPRRAVAGRPLRSGTILTRVRLRAREPGPNRVGLQVPRRFVKRILATRIRKATLSLRLLTAGGGTINRRTTIKLTG